MWKNIINSQYFTVIYPLCLILSVIVGSWLARSVGKSESIVWKPSGIETVMIALFSLILSFTFLGSNNLKRDRLNIADNMKDAIISLRRVSLTTNDNLKAETKNFLLGFLKMMGEFKNNYPNDEHFIKREMDELNGNYLRLLYKETRKNPENRNEVYMLIPFVNRLDGAFERLVDSLDDRTPPIIMILLVVSSLLTSVLIGLLNRFNRNRHYLVPLIFIITVALSIQSIRDRENPQNVASQLDFSDFFSQATRLVT